MSSLDELLGTASALVSDGRTPACQLAIARDGEIDGLLAALAPIVGAPGSVFIKARASVRP